MNAKEQQTMLDSDIPRITGLLVIEVRDSNPNGDPDNAGFPRQRPDGRGEISPVSIKRKLRELVASKDGPVWAEMKRRLSLGEDADKDFDILETRGRDRKVIIAKMQDGRFETEYWDARLFGSTFLESRDAVEKEMGRKLTSAEWQKLQKTIRTGVAHFGVGISVAPVHVRFESWSNKAGVEEGLDRGMAPQALKYVEHGLYTVPFFVNPTQAGKTKCTVKDVHLMLQLLKHAFRDNPSTGRTQVEILHAHAVEHKVALGSFSDFALLDAFKPCRVPSEAKEKPSTSIADYIIPQWDCEQERDGVKIPAVKSLPVRPNANKTFGQCGTYRDYALDSE